MNFLLKKVVPVFGYLYLTFAGRTSRFRWEGLEHIRDLEERGSNWIYAFWHNRQLLFSCTHRGRNIAIMVSQSKDGDIVTQIMRYSQIAAIRGSSSRGALTATREMVAALKTGIRVGVTPDGPKGPVYTVKPGALFAALKTGLPIIPIANAMSRKLVLKKSWDHYQVPAPFSYNSIVHGRPLFVKKGDDLAEKALELETELNRITAAAEKLVGN